MRELTAISRPSIKRTHVAAGATPLLHKTRRVLHEWNAKGLVKTGYRSMHPNAECEAEREPAVPR